jgi:hypothetical protein
MPSSRHCEFRLSPAVVGVGRPEEVGNQFQLARQFHRRDPGLLQGPLLLLDLLEERLKARLDRRLPGLQVYHRTATGATGRRMTSY